MLRLLTPLFFTLWLALPSLVWAQAEAPAVANKRLFDRTVDELNFRTMENVYDKTFTRNKFPVSLRTHQARKSFDGFQGNADLKRLFLNYNDVSEKFKNRFGKGRTDLAEFEKQLRSIIIDKNFEFFIRVLPRNERVALIHSLQRVTQQAAAQFNASEDPAPDELAADDAAVPPADAETEPPVTAPVEESEAQPESVVTPARTATIRSVDVTSRHDWLDYSTLLLAGTSTLALLYLVFSVLPDLRGRLDSLAEELDQRQPNATPRRRSSPSTLPEDRYEEEEEQ
ncbi:hypothetical protein [Hymenobacter crusticola]|uniref:Uncharacterized protein n=1 Tax=Hymenobacter crusticola TaxID=1770526 RepID=A0A243WCC6_9BACT|nr:hypothetical protein [Hymenobacter crusticola]OUJ72677.1 hypothetical protein BXP70_17355 [Hymenobacter crusticola]